MGSRWLKFVGVWVVIALSLSGCASYRTHPEFKKRHKSLVSLASLNPDVEVLKVRFGGQNEELHELYEPIKSWTLSEMEAVFKEKGYTWKPLDFDPKAIDSVPELRGSMFAVQELYKKLLVDIFKHRSGDFIYTVGAEINPIADWAESNAVVLVRWQAYKKSGGEIAKDMTMSVLLAAATLGSVVAIQAPSEAMAQVSVIDGDTGEILWFHFNTDTWLDVAQEEHVRRAIKTLLKPFPKSAVVQAQEKAQRKQRERKSKSNIMPAGVPAGPAL